MAINLAELAFLEWQKEEEVARQKAVVLCRQFYDGLHDTKLTPRQREFLNAASDHEFNVNIARSAVESIEERLVITGATSTDAALAVWADQQWDLAGGVVRTGADRATGVMQSSVHEGCGRDGEYFVIVDWDVVAKQPRWTPHSRYTDPAVNGDGFGCKAHYPDGDTTRPMQYASKRWIELLDARGKTRARMNLYFPDRVEKYNHQGNGWIPFRDPDDPAWPLPWVDAAGEPLGIPVIHFPATPDLRSDMWDVIPVQRGFNKSVLDLLAAADTTGFRILVTLGWIPTADGQPLKADGSNRAKIAPGTILGTTKPKSEAGTESVEGANLAQLIDAATFVRDLLPIVSTVPQFPSTRQLASAETLQEQKERLFAKARKRQVLCNQSWLACFAMARRLANVFGRAGLNEDALFSLQWLPLQSRNTQDERDEWRVKKELGIPLEQIWREMGYSDIEIAAMQATPEYQARLALTQMGLGNGAA